MPKEAGDKEPVRLAINLELPPLEWSLLQSKARAQGVALEELIADVLMDAALKVFNGEE